MEADKSRLIFRLSSLGDVILASSVLSAFPPAQPVDWVVAREFADVLRGHPGIRKLWEFDRKTGLRGWLELCRVLQREGYSEVYDLHCTLRTRIARVVFRLSGGRLLVWRKFSKERWKLYGLFIFKKLWPSGLRPELFVRRFTSFAGGTGQERPDLTHLLKPDAPSGAAPTPLPAPLNEPGFPITQTYYCVMPGSKWKGKRWPAAKFLEAIERIHGTPVILGGPADEESLELVSLLKSAGHPSYSGVGRWDLAQAARVLAGSLGYLGNDTGLAHLAEAVGCPALVIFGPTAPEMGFGPWRPESGAVGIDLFCRPCGKDGRRCYRPFNKYLCMTGLDAKTVAGRFTKLSQTRPPKASPKVLL